MLLDVFFFIACGLVFRHWYYLCI